MRAMILRAPHTALELANAPDPQPGAGQVVVRVHACGVCRTDLHVVDGELPDAKSPIIPGHEIVGTVTATGSGVDALRIGDRVGVPWLGHTCGVCRYCRAGQENLCDAARFTGCTIDGGYADYAVADARYCFALPEGFSDLELAPWLCAGLIGYRALRMAGDARRIGIYGFGAAAHIVAQLARHEGRAMYAFTRPGDAAAQAFARELGAVWAGGSDLPAPEPLDAAIIFAAGRRAGAESAARRRQRRHRRLRRHSHDRHTAVSVRDPLGRTAHRFRREPDPARRGGIHGTRRAGAGPDQRRRLSVGRRQRRATGVARGRADRRRRVVVAVIIQNYVSE